MLERYNPILIAIRKLCPTAHIGGGAVRDTLLERPLKDVDLFLDDKAIDDAAKLLRSQFAFVKVGEWEQYEMFSEPVIARVTKFEKHDEVIPLCLIGLKETRNLKANLARFDFGICMAGWDGDKVYVAPEYKRDVESKSFTMTRADNLAQFSYSHSRFEKMTAERYVGWKLVVPPKFSVLAAEHALHKYYYQDYDTNEWMPREIVGPQKMSPKAR